MPAGPLATMVVGFNLFDPSSYHEVVDNPGKVVSEAAASLAHPDKLVSDAAKSLQPILNVAKDIASNAIGAISLIPGIGTGVAAALSAGLAVLEGGSALDIAIKTAYGAIPIPPGIKQFTDIVLDGVLSLLDDHGDLGDTVVTGIKNGLMERIPDFAKGIASSAFDTLAHLVIQAVGGKPTLAAAGKPLSAAHVQAAQLAHAQGKPLPPSLALTPVAPTSRAHLALHLGLAMPPPPLGRTPLAMHLGRPAPPPPPAPTTSGYAPGFPLRAFGAVGMSWREVGNPLGADHRTPWMGPQGYGAQYITRDQDEKGDLTLTPAWIPQWQSRAQLEPEGSRD